MSRGRPYRTIDGLTHHQCPTCAQWKPSSRVHFYQSGRGGKYLQRTCIACQNAIISPIQSAARKAALALCDRLARAPAPPPAPQLEVRVEPPDLGVIGAVPSLAALFAQFDA